MAGFFRRMLPKWLRKDGTVIPVVRMSGVIMSSGSPFRPALNLAGVSQALDKAFGVKDAPAVAIAINSPGGSPVQSRLIYGRIRDLAREKQKKVLVFHLMRWDETSTVTNDRVYRSVLADAFSCS